MECENCGEPATVHFTTISTIGQRDKVEQHYCQRCAWPFVKTTGEPSKLLENVKKVAVEKTDWERMYRNEIESHRKTDRVSCQRAARVGDLEAAMGNVRVAINELVCDLFDKHHNELGDFTKLLIDQLKRAADTPKEQ